MADYIRMYEKQYHASNDNPTIGLILCSKRNEAIVKYSILKESNQFFSSGYLLYLPSEEEFKKEIERERSLLESKD